MSINQVPSSDIAQAYKHVWLEVSRPAAGATFSEWIRYRLVVTGGGRPPIRPIYRRQDRSRLLRAQANRAKTGHPFQYDPTATPLIRSDKTKVSHQAQIRGGRQRRLLANRALILRGLPTWPRTDRARVYSEAVPRKRFFRLLANKPFIGKPFQYAPTATPLVRRGVVLLRKNRENPKRARARRPLHLARGRSTVTATPLVRVAVHVFRRRTPIRKRPTFRFKPVLTPLVAFTKPTILVRRRRVTAPRRQWFWQKAPYYATTTPLVRRGMQLVRSQAVRSTRLTWIARRFHKARTGHSPFTATPSGFVRPKIVVSHAKRRPTRRWIFALRPNVQPFRPRTPVIRRRRPIAPRRHPRVLRPIVFPTLRRRPIVELRSHQLDTRTHRIRRAIINRVRVIIPPPPQPPRLPIIRKATKASAYAHTAGRRPSFFRNPITAAVGFFKTFFEANYLMTGMDAGEHSTTFDAEDLSTGGEAKYGATSFEANERNIDK